MSTTSFTWSFPAKPADLPANVGALEDVAGLLNQVSEAHLLMSASRNNWLLDNLSLLCSLRGLRHLHRLGSTSSVLSVAEIPAALGEIELLFRLVQEAPHSVAAALNPPCEAAEISAALAASQEAITPHLGPTGADEGDGPQYLFSWLKSLRALLRHAHGSASCVVHVQPKSRG
jgi:hypothetical protein